MVLNTVTESILGQVEIYEDDEKDTQHGYGKYTWADGSVYEGNWENGAQHGYGKHTWVSGKIYEGEWRNGKMVD